MRENLKMSNCKNIENFLNKCIYVFAFLFALKYFITLFVMKCIAVLKALNFDFILAHLSLLTQYYSLIFKMAITLR